MKNIIEFKDEYFHDGAAFSRLCRSLAASWLVQEIRVELDESSRSSRGCFLAQAVTGESAPHKIHDNLDGDVSKLFIWLASQTLLPLLSYRQIQAAGQFASDPIAEPSKALRTLFAKLGSKPGLSDVEEQWLADDATPALIAIAWEMKKSLESMMLTAKAKFVAEVKESELLGAFAMPVDVEIAKITSILNDVAFHHIEDDVLNEKVVTLDAVNLPWAVRDGVAGCCGNIPLDCAVFNKELLEDAASRFSEAKKIDSLYLVLEQEYAKTPDDESIRSLLDQQRASLLEEASTLAFVSFENDYKFLSEETKAAMVARLTKHETEQVVAQFNGDAQRALQAALRSPDQFKKFDFVGMARGNDRHVLKTFVAQFGVNAPEIDPTESEMMRVLGRVEFAAPGLVDSMRFHRI